VFLMHAWNLSSQLAQAWWAGQCILLVVEPLHLLPRVFGGNQ